MTQERRYNGDISFQADEQQPRRIIGHAAVFDNPTTIRGRNGDFQEIIRPGAFARVLAEQGDVLGLVDHSGTLLGRTSAGTLRIKEDSAGLYYEIDDDGTTLFADTYARIKAGNLRGNSFGFTVGRDTWKRTPGVAVREIHEVGRLLDVGPATMPAYQATDIDVRSACPEPPNDHDERDRLEIARRRKRIASIQSGEYRAEFKRILFLDDNPTRIKDFKSRFPAATIVTTAADAIAEMQRSEFDVVSLDHDLDGQENADPAGDNTGSAVVRWMQANRPKVGRVMVHSLNAGAAVAMVDGLRASGITAQRSPFHFLAGDISNL